MLLDAGYALKTDSSSKQRAPGEISAGPIRGPVAWPVALGSWL